MNHNKSIIKSIFCKVVSNFQILYLCGWITTAKNEEIKDVKLWVTFKFFIFADESQQAVYAVTARVSCE